MLERTRTAGRAKTIRRRREGSAEKRFSPIRFLLTFWLLSWCACTAAPSPTPSWPPRFETAGPSPALQLPLLGGDTLSLGDLRGKVVLLHFWATWCMPCVAEIAALDRLARYIDDPDFVVLAVSVDTTPGPVRQFVQRRRLGLPVLLDMSGTVQRRYRAYQLPHSVLIDRAGNLVRFPDPKDGQPVTAVIGTRDWDSADAVALIRSVLTWR